VFMHTFVSSYDLSNPFLCFVCASVCTPVFVSVSVDNFSKLLLSPRHGTSFAAAAAAMSDRQDIASFHDISSFRYMQLCILLHIIFRIVKRR